MATETVDPGTDTVEGAYDPKQKYTTVTSINHGYLNDEGNPVQLLVEPNTSFSDVADNFTDDEKNAFVLQGTIVPLSDVNADISDENDALKAELQAAEAEKEKLEADKFDLADQVKKLEAALEAAKKSAATPAK